MTVDERIGIVGLGAMGQPVAARLLAAGRRLVAYDLNAAAVSHLVAAGAEAADSPRSLAACVDVLITVLPNGPDVEAVADGPDGLLAGAAPGLLWIDMSTIDPEVTRRVAARAAAGGVRVIDAAIGGLTSQAGQGALTLMVGADAPEMERARPLLEVLSNQIHHCGPVGAGVTMKLINNLLAGVTFVATCEALLLGRKAGLTVETMSAVLSGTAADTAHLRRSVPTRVLARDFQPGFRLTLMRKDADLAIGLAHRLNAPLTLGSAVQELRSVAIGRGLGAQDTTSLVQVLEDLAGIRLEAAADVQPAVASNGRDGGDRK